MTCSFPFYPLLFNAGIKHDAFFFEKVKRRQITSAWFDARCKCIFLSSTLRSKSRRGYIYGEKIQPHAVSTLPRPHLDDDEAPRGKRRHRCQFTQAMKERVKPSFQQAEVDKRKADRFQIRRKARMPSPEGGRVTFPKRLHAGNADFT
jgi:hypothetical protein